VFKKNTKIGILVGLNREKKSIPKHKNIIVESGYSLKAFSATKKLIKQNVDLIVNFGFAGALKNNLKNCDILIPKDICNENFRFKKNSNFLSGYFKKKIDEKVKTYSLLTSKKVLKKVSKDKNVSAVDMEAYYAQKAALEGKVPFISIKVIFDDIDNPIPEFIIKSLNSDGNIIYFRLFLELLARPSDFSKLIKINKLYSKSIIKLEKVAKKFFLDN
jgi:hypothetical protein